MNYYVNRKSQRVHEYDEISGLRIVHFVTDAATDRKLK